MAASKGIRPSQWDLPFDEFRKLPALLPPLEEQRRIAQYLDGEVARLDALVNARILQSKTLRDWWQSYLASHMEDLIKEWGTIALRRIVSSVEQGWSPQCDDAEAQPDEWAVLKTSAVSSGRFLATEHKRLPADISPEVRYKIIDGDILMTRGSGSPEHVGVAVLARTEGRSLLLSDLLYRVRIGRARWSPEFVTLALSSRPIRGLIGLLLRGQSGQTIKLRGEDIKEICIPAAPLNVQHMISSDLALMRDRVQKAEAAVEESRILLAERRQALITAAVTGQFNVSSASGRGLTDGVPV
jgi:type I restriction enzyme S subunit